MKSVITTLMFITAAVVPSLAITTEKVGVDATAALRKSLSKAEKIFVYEGLPHQMYEWEQLKNELKRKDVVKLGGFPFYTPKVAVPEKDTPQLRELVSGSGSYVVFSGEKKCGGFHPDYAVAWSDGAKECAILFCYGCGEALIVDGAKSFRYNFKKTAELRKLLVPFESKRPSNKKKVKGRKKKVEG